MTAFWRLIISLSASAETFYMGMMVLAVVMYLGEKVVLGHLIS